MISTRLRFQTAVLSIGAGALLGVGAFCFGPSTESWIGLGVGAGLVIATIAAFATAGRGLFQRGLDLLLLPVSLWTLISARTIELAGHGASASEVKWLGLSCGAAIFLIGVLSLIGHELRVESDLRWAMDQLTGPDADEATADESASNGRRSADADRPMWLAPIHAGDDDGWRPSRRAGA